MGWTSLGTKKEESMQRASSKRQTPRALQPSQVPRIESSSKAWLLLSWDSNRNPQFICKNLVILKLLILVNTGVRNVFFFKETL